MSKLFFSIFLLIAGKTFAQNAAFDQKVEQLFFNVDISDRSLSMTEKLAAVKDISFQKIPSSTTTFENQRFIGITRYWYEFKSTTYLTSPFALGIIDMKSNMLGKEEVINDITWELQFDTKEAAEKAFDELKQYFGETGGKPKLFRVKPAMASVEYESTGSSKYPDIIFHLFNDNNPEKKFKIRLFVK